MGRAPLRIIAPAGWLDPLGGVERCLVEDAAALTARGHSLAVPYGADGALRAPLEALGADLGGPFRFALDSRRPVATLAGYAPSARWCRARRADVLWLNRAEHLVWGHLASRWARTPLVCHLHDLPMFNRLRLLSTGVARFVAVSGFVRDAWVDAGLPADRVTVVRNAVPQERYSPAAPGELAALRARAGLPPDAPVVLHCGRLDPGKGVGVLARAWRAVHERRPDAVLLLVGDVVAGAPGEEVERELAQLPPCSVRRLPATDDVVPLLRASDVVAFPTLLPETFGRVPVEAMSAGVPVVASRSGAVGEVLSGDAERFLVAPGSVEELTGALLRSLDWRRDEPGLGRWCSAWVATHLPHAAHVDALEDVLLEAARQKPVQR